MKGSNKSHVRPLLVIGGPEKAFSFRAKLASKGEERMADSERLSRCFHWKLEAESLSDSTHGGVCLCDKLS